MKRLHRLSQTLILLLLSAAASHAAATRDFTLFVVAMRDDPSEQMVIATDDLDLIERCRAELEQPVEERHLFPIGSVRAGHGGFNLAWTFHVDPDDWDLTEAAIEVCDARPSFVEENLESWLADVGQFCPWSGYLAQEIRSPQLPTPGQIEVELGASIGGFDLPIDVTGSGDGSGRLFVVEKTGRIMIVVEGVLQAEPFLDIADLIRSTSSEQGLLGLAFHPRFEENGWFFVNYTNLPGHTVISRFEVTADQPDRAEASTEVILLSVEQPFANHNGGGLEFGGDGYLYVGLGDGGSGGDPFDSGQDPRALLGKLLRLDVDSGTDIVPEDNPFVSDPSVRDEIWALGLRNPWRFAFDSFTGDLYIADVGQNEWEEISVEGSRSPGGKNWGWNRMEGFHCFQETDCLQDGFSLPAAEYDHSEGCSVTGGVVYRGERFPFLDGAYLFADFCSGRLWTMRAGGSSGWSVSEVGQADVSISSFGIDDSGEVWVTGLWGGSVSKLEAIVNPVAPRRSGRRQRP